MIRPCDECGGSGWWPTEPEGLEPLECPRCADMPRLPCPCFHDEAGRCQCSVMCGGRGWFTPDPDSVMPWCQTHKSILYFNRPGESPHPTDDAWWWCEHMELGFPGSPSDCVIVWVPAITEADRLEEA